MENGQIESLYKSAGQFISYEASQERIEIRKNDFTCNVCKSVFSLKSYLIKHQLTHCRRKHACETCGRIFYLNASLKRHLLRHEKEKWFRCGICQKIFSKNEHLIAHKFAHDVTEYFPCTMCPARFSLPADFENHMKLLHSDSSLIQGVCKQINSLQMWFKTVCVRRHITEPPLPCEPRFFNQGLRVRWPWQKPPENLRPCQLWHVKYALMASNLSPRHGLNSIGVETAPVSHGEGNPSKRDKSLI